MRRASLPLLAAALASTASAAPTPARHVATVGLARATPAFRLPSEPWRSLRRVELPSPCAQPAVLLPDGTLAVGLEAPAGVAFVARRGDVIATVRLPSRITRPLAVGADGRVFVTAAREVFTVAPDGTVRNAAGLASNAESPVHVRADGSGVLITAPNGGAFEFMTLTPQGDPARVIALQGAQRAQAALDDGRVAVATPQQVVTLDARGRLEWFPSPGEVRHLASQDGAVGIATGAELLLADARMVVRAAVPLRGLPAWVAAVGAGRFAVAVAVPNVGNELCVVEGGGALAWCAPIPPETRTTPVDSAGSILLAARGGEVLALADDGRERWRLTTHETLRPPAVPLPRGGVAIATEGAALLLLDDAP